MANLQIGIEKSIAKNRSLSLDTLEHHDHDQCLIGLQPIKKGNHPLLKKAKNTFFSKELAKNLMYLDSKLKKGYKRTFYDCCSLMLQEGKKITTRYCGARWCNNCNRIRTAKMLNGYLKPLKEYTHPYFVTLTIPNVNKADLKHSIKLMMSASINSIRTLKRKGMAVNGIRKFECTYNANQDNYHPHFHFIISSKKVANELINEWLNRFPEASHLAQDITKATEIKELFKYQTKMITKVNNDHYIFLSALDTIFTAIKGMRTFQSFGNLKKVNDDINDLQSEEYDIEPYELVIWKWEKNDWLNMENGNRLTKYKPSNRMLELTNQKMVT